MRIITEINVSILQLDVASVQTFPILDGEINILSVFEPNDSFPPNVLGINTFFAEPVLLMLHVPCQRHCFGHPKEKWNGISRQD